MHSQQLKISCIEQLLFEMNLFSSYAFKINKEIYIKDKRQYNKIINIFFNFI
jgi:hypothetical protein